MLAVRYETSQIFIRIYKKCCTPISYMLKLGFDANDRLCYLRQPWLCSAFSRKVLFEEGTFFNHNEFDIVFRGHTDSLESISQNHLHTYMWTHIWPRLVLRTTGKFVRDYSEQWKWREEFDSHCWRLQYSVVSVTGRYWGRSAYWRNASYIYSNMWILLKL